MNIEDSNSSKILPRESFDVSVFRYAEKFSNRLRDALCREAAAMAMVEANYAPPTDVFEVEKRHIDAVVARLRDDPDALMKVLGFVE